MKKRYLISLASFIILLIGIMITMYIPKKASSDHSVIQPTVFVHGYKGTENSFGHMLKRFEKQYKWGNTALIYYVSPQGEIQVYNLSRGKQNPVFIQVVFENNRASFADNTEWLASVTRHMKEYYQMNTINLVGHSMGGIVSLKYINEYQDPETYPAVDKLITIGSPFEGIYNQSYFKIHHDPAATDLKPNSVALELLRENTNAFPENISVLSIGSTGDIVAAPESVASLRSMIPENQLEEIMIENDHLGHSALHENETVDQYIHSFLWQNDRQ